MDESVIKHLEQQQVGKLKLSEAIRAGCLMRPRKCMRAYFHDTKAACALGAAWLVMYGNESPPSISSISESDANTWFGVPRSILREIVHRNDDLGETREQIADWLQSKGC